MNYKILANGIVIFCLLIGAALMAYADIKKRDLTKTEQIESPQNEVQKHKTCPSKLNT
jgi:hypothetical protein